MHLFFQVAENLGGFFEKKSRLKNTWLHEYEDKSMRINYSHVLALILLRQTRRYTLLMAQEDPL